MSKLTRRAVVAAGALIPAVPLLSIAAAAQSPAPKDAYLYIIWPNDGQRIKGAFWCRFGLRNMGIARAAYSHSASVGRRYFAFVVFESQAT